MIDNLKELEKFLKLCRKQGVTKINFDNVNVELGEMPEERQASQIDAIEDPYKNFPAGELTPEQLMYYSSGGRPENDPDLKEKVS